MSASSDVPPIASMPMPCLPACSAPVGELADATAISIAGGAFEVYDTRNNAIASAGPMGQVGQEWAVAGFGDFSTRANETDMLLQVSQLTQAMASFAPSVGTAAASALLNQQTAPPAIGTLLTNNRA